MSAGAVPRELRSALEVLRGLRERRPAPGCPAAELAGWWEEVAVASEVLAGVLVFPQDRRRYRAEAAFARGEAERVRGSS
ncbi:hypothetical protein [Streptomyces lavendulae]|uniref:hypothetical protein n=1 Tax=Streptomyces lavendulae TaxID=1914 RepID=UPI00249FD1C1|nr:hypothetical protein [Streptomyces lavendulae]GLV81853.1 hypothetical protein Slala03_15420 [Streptomyces lavendulae subsp. lavendulae]GLX39970.1 hypothetical protein Sros01_60430 [Streptomyces roseochromogenus]